MSGPQDLWTYLNVSCRHNVFKYKKALNYECLGDQIPQYYSCKCKGVLLFEANVIDFRSVAMCLTSVTVLRIGQHIMPCLLQKKFSHHVIDTVPFIYTLFKSLHIPRLAAICIGTFSKATLDQLPCLVTHFGLVAHVVMWSCGQAVVSGENRNSLSSIHQS